MTTVAFSETTQNIFAEGTLSTNATHKAYLGPLDIVIVVVYILATLIIGIWASRKGVRDNVKGYFLAGRNMTWLPVGASTFASNIGSGHFIGLAGAGAAGGIAIGSFEWLAPFSIAMLGWIFLPIYLLKKVYTMPEYLHARFGGNRLRVTLSVISLALYVLTKIAVDLYAGALFIQQAFEINLYLAIVTLLVITAIYTVLGGLKAVIYTDTLQTVIMLAGGIVLMIMSFDKVGGYEQLKILYMEAIPQSTLDILESGNITTCGIPNHDAFHIFRDPINSDLPWPGMLIGIFLLGSWYWCTDQVIVQRTLAAKDIQHAKGGCIVAGYLKIIPMYMIVMTGMISRVFYPNEVACTIPSECEKICGNNEGCSNIAYPKLVLELMPSGLRGLMVAAMLSALMSSLTSIFNSSSTIFTIDIWKRIRKTATQREMLIVGKITVCVLVAISILWIPVLLSSAGGQLFLYLQSIQSALGPPIFALYLFAVTWPRVNEQGAFWGLLSGFSAGVIRLVLDFYYKAPGCDNTETRPAIVYRMNYLHVSPIVFLISCIVTLTVSYCTNPLSQKQLENATWFTRVPSAHEEIKGTGEVIESLHDLEIHKLSAGDENNASVQLSECADHHLKMNWGMVLNSLAVVMLLVVTFLFGYYA